ncbi:triose-phosphate isomerase [Pigmentiphaga aceris]|uniref:Triosephosphate isomerase n=1 Tax=Pigmentiphaga aceris TaxID=1940612 RepID=A0A5C0AYR3_9BURK|nr:triose-phosphate isomerase [Pigmentiphaga aceris]QEI05701.1 triose-phosphate isomerase [Pigmentiphaga aceris]
MSVSTASNSSGSTASKSTASKSIRKLVLGNWKLHGTLSANGSLLSAVREGVANSAITASCDVGVCVPFPYLAQAESALTGSDLAWGAQDVSAHASGAYTGEVSATMLRDFGSRYVLVGHSERRMYHAESDQLVADKAKIALDAGLIPVVCIGESLAEREADQTLSIVERQLAPVLALGSDVVRRLVIAYEPVWAIGTGKTASPEQAQDVHAAIRKLLGEDGASVRLLYGGSVKGANAASLFAMADIDGGLIGGAALNAEEFLRIAEAGASTRSF